MKKLVAILSGLVLFLLVLYLAVFMGLSRGWALLGLALLLLLVYLLVPRARVQAVRILNSWIWFWVGLLALAGLFLPIQTLSPYPGSVQGVLAVLKSYTVFFLLPLAPMIAAMLLYQGIRRRSERHSLQFGNVMTITMRVDIYYFLILALLLAVTLYNFYWLIVWDSTGDALGFLWLISPLFAAVFAGLMLTFVLKGR